MMIIDIFLILDRSKMWDTTVFVCEKAKELSTSMLSDRNISSEIEFRAFKLDSFTWLAMRCAEPMVLRSRILT